MKSPATLFAYQSMARPQHYADRRPTHTPKRQPAPRTVWARLFQLFFFIR